MPHQIAVTVRAPLKEGRGPEVAALLETLRKDVEQDGGPFAGMPGVHFARVFVLPGDAELDVPCTLVYLAEVDAPLRRHLDEVMEHDQLTSLFTHCADFPERGVRADRLRVGRSAQQVSDEARLRGAIVDFLDGRDRSGSDRSGHDASTPHCDRSGHDAAAPHSVRGGRPAPDQERGVHPAPDQGPREVHRAVQEFIRSRPDLAWALTPAAPPGPLFRAREALHALGWAAALLPVSPLLLAVLPGWLLLVRRHEKRDVPETARPDRAHVAALTAGEDHGTPNPFTAYGRVKPGVVRGVTIRVALRGLDYAARHVFARDNLAGVRSIHFARWVLLDGGRRVVFASDYDGSQESYMSDFIDRVAWGVNLVFSNGAGYPSTRWLVGGGARDEQRYKAYLRNHQLPSVWFSAYPTLSARNVDDNSALRDGVPGELTEEGARRWLSLVWRARP
jgi:hypothetical protein